ncbi:hypothetical protein WJX73_004765 [Symbiochloris irregularis]|uniref:Uncharacterized protein n=1 Tax=Symbiochloris irregularis TaxID=706552 RepID=A0AAW1P134_9CHLO
MASAGVLQPADKSLRELAASVAQASAQGAVSEQLCLEVALYLPAAIQLSVLVSVQGEQPVVVDSGDLLTAGMKSITLHNLSERLTPDATADAVHLRLSREISPPELASCILPCAVKLQQAGSMFLFGKAGPCKALQGAS